MPLAFRAKGASLSTATNWLFNWCVAVALALFRLAACGFLRAISVGFVVLHMAADVWFCFVFVRCGAHRIVGEATPILQDIITWRLYPMHAFFCACSFVLV